MKNLKSRKKKEEKRLLKEEKALEKKELKAKKAGTGICIVSYFFVCIFISLIGYMVYFQVVEAGGRDQQSL